MKPILEELKGIKGEKVRIRCRQT